MHDPGPRLLIATTDFPPARGGIQRLLHELASRLAARWRITVLAPADPAAAAYDAAAGFRVLRTRTDWRGSPPGVLGEMALIVARTPADVLLAGHLNALPPLFASLPPRPKVALIYGSELWAGRTRLVARTLGPGGRRMAISRFTAAEAERAGLRPERIVLTPCGATAPAPAPGRGRLEALGLVRAGRSCPSSSRSAGSTSPTRATTSSSGPSRRWSSAIPDLQYVVAGAGRSPARSPGWPTSWGSGARCA